MITTVINPSTFVLSGVTYKAGQTISLSEDESEILQALCEVQDDIVALRKNLWTRCINTEDDFSLEAAALYHDYELLTSKHSFESLRLVSMICRRLGGLIPLKIVVNRQGGETPHVEVTSGSANLNLQLDMARIRRGTQYDSVVGDMLYYAARLRHEDKPPSAGVHALVTDPEITLNVDEWQETGVPTVFFPSSCLTDYDFEEASDMTSFDSEDHETNGHFVPRVLKALTGVLTRPGRAQEIISQRAPMAQLFVTIGPFGVAVANLTNAAGPDRDARETAKVRHIHDMIRKVDGTALALIQYGVLDPDGSGIDRQPANQPRLPEGIRVSLSLLSNEADERFISGAFQYTVRANPEGVVLDTFAYHEDNPCLPNRDGVAKLRELWAPQLTEQESADENEPDVAAAER